jgi:hypothetical protein
MTGEERKLIDRLVFCLFFCGVLIAYYIWRSFKPEHWTPRDYDGYKSYPSTIELPDWFAPQVRRYKEMVRERLRKET